MQKRLEEWLLAQKRRKSISELFIFEKYYATIPRREKFIKSRVIIENPFLNIFPGEERHDHWDILTNFVKTTSVKGIKDRAYELSKKIRKNPNQIRVKEQQSRWGSCSSKQNLNLNWRLCFVPKKVMDYVIIHEIVHLKHFNHSKEFWKTVENYCPDYEVSSEWLKEYGTHVLNILN